MTSMRWIYTGLIIINSHTNIVWDLCICFHTHFWLNFWIQNDSSWGAELTCIMVIIKFGIGPFCGILSCMITNFWMFLLVQMVLVVNAKLTVCTAYYFYKSISKKTQSYHMIYFIGQGIMCLQPIPLKILSLLINKEWGFTSKKTKKNLENANQKT